MLTSSTPLRRTALAGLLASTALISAHAALADATINTEGASQTLSIEQASQLLHYSGGNDRMRAEVAPNYSEELGFSLKGAVGGYLSDEIALGLIVEYGEHKREYLANAGVQFNETLSLVGTIGLLEEHNAYVDGEGRETVQQMEYGASLKGAYELGLLSAFELNGYLADADADSDSVETGRLYGVQLLADIDLTDTTHFKLGGGYEWLEWDDTNDDDSRWTFSAEAAQQLGEMLSLTGHARLGASGQVYGGGLAFDLSNSGPNTNMLNVNYNYIDGKNGIEDDQRIELSWTYGFGAGPNSSVAAAELTDKSGTIRAAADVAMVSPANNLLNDVMKRPAFLPERVLARTAPSTVLPIKQLWTYFDWQVDSNGEGEYPFDRLSIRLTEEIKAAGLSGEDFTWKLVNETDGTTWDSTNQFDEGNWKVEFSYQAFGEGSVNGWGLGGETVTLTGTAKINGLTYTYSATELCKIPACI